MEMPTNVASSATTNFAPGMQSVGFDNAQEAPLPSQDHNDQAKNYLPHIHPTNVTTERSFLPPDAKSCSLDAQARLTDCRCPLPTPTRQPY